MSKFLVTGGAGFIGSHIVEALVKEGHFVRTLDNFSSGKEENLSFIQGLSPRGASVPASNFELIKGDIRDKETCLKAAKGIDFILHQAALRSVPKSLGNPKEYNEVNIQGTLNMLEAAKESKIKFFVFASSSSIYGDTEKFPQKEDAPSRLISPYALTKLTGEYYCRIFSKNYGLNTVSLRYFNVFGPRQALDDEYAVVIPKFITCILKDEPPPIYGNGRQSRDFTYVANVVEANILAAQNHNFEGEVFNIASNRDYRVLELVKILNQLMKKNIKPVFLNPRPGDVLRTFADIRKAKKLLGFRPRIDFVQGLKLTMDYFQEKWLKKQ